VALNGVLLFVVLFCVYPLKFVFTMWRSSAAESSSRWSAMPTARALSDLRRGIRRRLSDVRPSLPARLPLAPRTGIERDRNVDTKVGFVSAVATGAVGAASMALTLIFGSRANGWI
ncbi:MAG: hypothetical protein LC780_16430, partial [Acidobacteria bacterium]|nr:hypothetical protein [Acidobacteriota bacterium]